MLIICVFVLSILSLFWAVQYRVEDNLPSLTVWVIDFDGQVEPYRTNETIVGPAVTDVAAQIINSTTDRLGYTIVSPAAFNYDVWNVRQQIYDEHAYAAIVVNPNATTMLRGAAMNGNTTYDPAGAIQSIVISARDETTYYNYIFPALNEFRIAFHALFGPRWVHALVQESADISRVPQAVNPGVEFNTLDLRPFAPAVITPAVTIGLIYLIIVAFFNFPFLMPIHMQLVKGNHPPLQTWQWLVWRIITHIISYFFMSLFYSFVSLAFQIPFTNSPAPGTESAANPNAYGHGSFVVFWMLNWVGMAALGFPCENMAMILGMPWSSFFLIFWVITNVSTAFYDLDLAPQFFAWGRAWPLHRSKYFYSFSFSLEINANHRSRRGYTDDSFRHTFSHWLGLWGSLCVDWGFACVLSIRKLYYAVEGQERHIKKIFFSNYLCLMYI